MLFLEKSVWIRWLLIFTGSFFTLLNTALILNYRGTSYWSGDFVLVALVCLSLAIIISALPTIIVDYLFGRRMIVYITGCICGVLLGSGLGYILSCMAV